MSTMTSFPVSVGIPASTGVTRPAPLRLTRRGRVVLFTGALLLLLGVVYGLGLALAGSEATSEAGTAPATEVVTVGTGETLWDIAGALAADGAGGGDLRAVMTDIEDLNDLDSAMLLAGQELRVPVVE